MVDLSDYLDPDGEEAAADAEDLAALKQCLKALADALASTNLAVINAARGDAPRAAQRVQASLGALKQFSQAFAVLDASAPDAREAAPEA